MNSWWNLITEYAWLYNVSYYFVICYWLYSALGWFFSTDYYDNMIKDQAPDVEKRVMLVCSVIIAAGAISIALCGFTNIMLLVIDTIVWVLVVIPCTIGLLLDLRVYLRTKRGKS